jgi:hypothetical protein
MQITDSFGQTANLKIPDGVKAIGVSMSGGADSSILCYLLAKQIKEQQLDVIIHPISARFAIRPWSYDHAKRVVNFIASDLKCAETFGKHYYFNVPEDECESDNKKEKHFNHIMSFLFVNNVIDHLFSGKTKNPSKEVMNKFNDQNPQLERNNPTEKNIYKAPVETVPWAMVDKRLIVDQYKKNNLINSLLPLTRSCEGDIKITENFTKECGKCWWCEEREWALKQVNG